MSHVFDIPSERHVPIRRKRREVFRMLIVGVHDDGLVDSLSVNSFLWPLGQMRKQQTLRRLVVLEPDTGAY